MASASVSAIEAVEEGRPRGPRAVPDRPRNPNRPRRNADPWAPTTACRMIVTILILFLLVLGGIYLKHAMGRPSEVGDGLVAIVWIFGFVIALNYMDSWAPTNVLQYVARVFALLLLIAFGIYVFIGLNSIHQEEVYKYLVVSLLCLTGFAVLLYYSCYDMPWTFAPSSQWVSEFRRRRALRNRNRESEASQTSTTLQNLESQTSSTIVERPDSEPEPTRQTEGSQAADQSPTTLGEGDAILRAPVAVNISAVQKISGVASSISQIVAESVSGKSENVEASRTSAADDKAKASSQSGQKIESESELLSSGELRRRKLNPDELSKSSNSSDEEPKKE